MVKTPAAILHNLHRLFSLALSLVLVTTLQHLPRNLVAELVLNRISR